MSEADRFENLIIEDELPKGAQLRHLRACMVCAVILMSSKFKQFGCPNCEGFLDLQGHEDTIQECTSADFEGTIALLDPAKSWAAKWQRLENYAPGNYAIKVIGTPPKEVIQDMEAQGIRYIPRDGTAIDADKQHAQRDEEDAAE